jgi:hypothetical protein
MTYKELNESDLMAEKLSEAIIIESEEIDIEKLTDILEASGKLKQTVAEDKQNIQVFFNPKFEKDELQELPIIIGKLE